MHENMYKHVLVWFGRLEPTCSLQGFFFSYLGNYIWSYTWKYVALIVWLNFILWRRLYFLSALVFFGLSFSFVAGWRLFWNFHALGVAKANFGENLASCGWGQCSFGSAAICELPVSHGFSQTKQTSSSATSSWPLSTRILQPSRIELKSACQ